MNSKIDQAIEYYNFKSKEIIIDINLRATLTVDEIIQYGEELSVLEYKITALEVAKEN
jgi:hypothetical protein